jgi:D-alanyl-D-alanine carboxypeptidase
MPMLRTRAYRARIEKRIRPGNRHVRSMEGMPARSATTSLTASPTAPTLTRRARRIRRVALALTTTALVALIAVAAHDAAGRMFASAASGGDPTEVIASALDTAPSAADGVVGSRHVSVFDDVPAVTGLDPALRAAVRAAAADAEADGVRFVVNSGWRSARLQEQLLDDAIAQYGSREEAARWVATPDTSAHVTGDAVDLGPWSALDWLAQRGAAYGLCQIYANEPWHYELRPEAAEDGCPRAYPDPTYDPRLR